MLFCITTIEIVYQTREFMLILRIWASCEWDYIEQMENKNLY